MNKYIYTPAQHKKMLDLIDAAIVLAPNWHTSQHRDILQTIRAALLKIKVATVFAPANDVRKTQIRDVQLMERCELDVVNYNLLLKYIRWARYNAKRPLIELLNELATILKSSHLELVGNNYTDIVMGTANAHVR